MVDDLKSLINKAVNPSTEKLEGVGRGHGCAESEDGWASGQHRRVGVLP